MKLLVEMLVENKKTVSTMESCTGGGLANAITNVPGASEVLQFSAVTYSNDFKIKMGVNSEVIDKYTVYSIETADEMSRNIAKFSGSTYGVGITGKLCRSDINNPCEGDDIVYISVYDTVNDIYYNKTVKVYYNDRNDNKELVIEEAREMLMYIMLEEIYGKKDKNVKRRSLNVD